jgi:hypothetical protein
MAMGSKKTAVNLRPFRFRAWLALPILLACNETSSNNFTTQAPPDTCTPQADVTGCNSGETGYACTGSQAPDDGDNELVCDDGSPGASGTTLYCCLTYAQRYSDCSADDGISGCQGGYGFSCTGATSPDMADTFLGCKKTSGDIEPDGGGPGTYCCLSVTTPASCVPRPSLACDGASVGYACTGTDTPDSIDTSVVCSRSASSVSQATGYCCLTYPQSPEGCQESLHVEDCSSDSYGFSCADGTTPQSAQPALSCTKGPSGNGQTSYCCTL